MFGGSLINVPSLLHKATSESRGKEGQKCLTTLRVLEAVCCAVSQILKLVAGLILRHLEPKICCVRQGPGESEDVALVGNVGYEAM